MSRKYRDSLQLQIAPPPRGAKAYVCRKGYSKAMATIKDVAKLAGVSVSTVSIVINGKEGERKFSDETCALVHQSISELGYNPNVSARKLRSLRHNKPVVALYWPLDSRSNSLGWVLKCIEKEFETLYFDCDLMVCGYKVGKLREDVKLCDNTSFSAVIIGGVSEEDLQYLESVAFHIPVILFSRYSGKMCCVCGDNQLLGEKAAELVYSYGYRSAAVISTSSEYKSSSARVKSFFEACKAYGIAIGEPCRAKNDSIPDGYLAGLQIAAEPDRPEVIFCQTDSIALGLIHALIESGLRVPQDIGVVATAFLDPEYVRYSNPPITTVSVPVSEIAAGCARMLINILNHNISGITCSQLEPVIEERASCAKRQVK